MRRVWRWRSALDDGMAPRLITWAWVVGWGEHAVSVGTSLTAQLAVAAAVVVMVVWEANQRRLKTWAWVPGATLLSVALALGAAGELRESTYLLGWGAVIIVLTFGARAGAVLVVTAATLAAGCLWWTHVAVDEMPALLLGAVSQFLVVSLLQQLARIARQLRRTQQRLADAEVETERNRLAHELGVVIGRTLSETAGEATSAREQIGDSAPDVQRHLEDVEALVERGSRQLAMLSFRPVVDDLESETTTARSLCNRLGVTFTAAVEKVDPAAHVIFALMLRESVTNMFKHATPRRCTLVARTQDGAALFSFTNDGVDGRSRATDTARGTGQARWREQVEELGGTLETGPLPDGRYRVFARIPTPIAQDEGDTALERSSHG